MSLTTRTAYTPERPPEPASATPEARPIVRGKFLFVGDEKLFVRG